MHVNTKDYRSLVIDLLSSALCEASIDPADVDDSLNIIDSGLVDSLRFLELVTNLERRAGVTLDLFDVDPDLLTTIGGLVELLCNAHQTQSTFSEKNR